MSEKDKRNAGSIVVLTGSPGTGKTTVAGILAKGKPRGLHIPADIFYEFPAHPISPYRPAGQEQTNDTVVAVTHTAAAFAGRGYDVILDGLFGPWLLPVIAGVLRPASVAVHYVVLRAPLEIALRRVQDRIGHDRDHVVRQMHAALADLGPFAAHVVETGSSEAAAVAGEVERRLASGEFLLDLSRVAQVAASSEHDLERLLEAFADAWNRHDVDALMSMMAEDGAFEASGGNDVNGERHAGQQAVRAAYAAVFAQYPDAHWGGARHFVHGDGGVSEWTFTGTLADGKRMEVNGCDLFTFRDGKIALKNSFRKNRPPRG